MAAHLSWKTKLRGFLDGKGSLDEWTAFNHKACGFGVWYESVGRKELPHISEINQIEKPHRELHALTKRSRTEEICRLLNGHTSGSDPSLKR
ncbi:MAG: CZB domain-containing protein [Candidatus Thiodiazotropha endolucinida]